MYKQNHDEIFCDSIKYTLMLSLPEVQFYNMATPTIMYEENPQTAYERASTNFSAFVNGLINEIEASKKKVVLVYEMFEKNGMFKFRGRVL